jgi:hypothetical protein
MGSLAREEGNVTPEYGEMTPELFEVGARGPMRPRTRRLERKRIPAVVAGDARMRSGSCARSNASARAGANLIDRSRNDH